MAASMTSFAFIIIYLLVFPSIGPTQPFLLSLFFCLLPFLVHASDQWWDLGKGFRIPDVYRTGYTVIGLSIVTSIALMLL